MPNWFDVAPRFGVAYDLFGNARTALKATVNKYMAGQTLSFAQRYNPLQLQSDTRTWDDRNGDNVAQDNEIGPSNNLSFGLPVFSFRPDPDIKREFDIETSAGIQHELVRGVSVTAAWYRRTRHNERRTQNLLVSPADYALVNVVSPLDGRVIPAYNLNPAKRGQVERVDFNSTNPDLRRRTYNGVEIGTAARMGPATFFGGWTFDRAVSVECDALENASNNPKSDYHNCDQSKLGLPFRHEIKLSGSYLLPLWGLQASAAFQSYAGPPLIIQWSISRSTRYAADCLAPCTPGALVIPALTPATYTLDLTANGERYYGRMNQLDISLRKLFRVGRYQWSGQLDVFNVTNSSYVKTQNRTWGSSLGQPTAILQPATLRLAGQLRF